MKTKKTKGKAIVPSKSAQAKKNRPARKSAKKSPEKEKKSSSLKKGVKKSLKVSTDLPAAPAPVVKKTSLRKPP